MFSCYLMQFVVSFNRISAKTFKSHAPSFTKLILDIALWSPLYNIWLHGTSHLSVPMLSLITFPRGYEINLSMIISTLKH